MYSCSLSQASGMDSIPVCWKLEILFFIKPLFRLPQQGEGKQTKLDNVGGDTPYDNGVAELQKILQMCICVLIRLATELASLHHVNEA